MSLNSIFWLPVIVTAVLMYFARVSHIAVLHYNLFLLLLMSWSGVVIGFFRFLHKTRQRADNVHE
jgi:hypothetical protein